MITTDARHIAQIAGELGTAPRCYMAQERQSPLHAPAPAPPPGCSPAHLRYSTLLSMQPASCSMDLPRHAPASRTSRSYACTPRSDSLPDCVGEGVKGQGQEDDVGVTETSTWAQCGQACHNRSRAQPQAGRRDSLA